MRNPFVDTLTGRQSAILAATKYDFDTVADLLADTTTIGYSGAKVIVAAGDYVTAQGFRYKVADSAASDHHITTAGGVKLYVAKGGVLHGEAFGMSSSKADTENAAILDVIMDYADPGSVVNVPNVQIDWASTTYNWSNNNSTILGADGEVVIGDVSINRATGSTGHIIFVNRKKNAEQTRVYVQPQETVLGQTGVVDDVVTSFTSFFDAYDAHGKEADTNPNWTGPHYRDGGVSCYAPSSPPGSASKVPYYAPAGHVGFNAKVGGNWWPFRPSAGLSVSQKPMVTAYELQPAVAKAGPTFAGGGVYPTDRWRPGKTYAVGDICHEYGRIYEVTVGGTSGQTPPLHDGVGGKRADAWDASILTTVGTLSGGFYVGTDGGGVVQYALIEQMYPTTMHKVLQLGPSLEETPMIGLGDSVQLTADMYIKSAQKLVAAKQNTDGSGFTNGAGLHADTAGAMFFGYGTNKGLQAKYNSTTNLYFNSVSVAYSEVVKPDGDTTVDVSGVNIVKFSDSVATNFSGFTGATQGQVIHLIFNNSNTTLVHNTSSLRIPGGANITPDSNDGYTVVMRSATLAQIMN